MKYKSEYIYSHVSLSSNYNLNFSFHLFYMHSSNKLIVIFLMVFGTPLIVLVTFVFDMPNTFSEHVNTCIYSFLNIDFLLKSFNCVFCSITVY